MRATKQTIITELDRLMIKPCWNEHGLNEKGAALADDILPLLVWIVRRVGPSVAAIALDEARFRVESLPTRNKKYQKKYLADNGET
jgi:hypothetical protein